MAVGREECNAANTDQYLIHMLEEILPWKKNLKKKFYEKEKFDVSKLRQDTVKAISELDGVT